MSHMCVGVQDDMGFQKKGLLQIWGVSLKEV